MTQAEKMALIYGVSIAGAAGVSYYRGRRGFDEIGQDAVLHGVLVGTGANVMMWLSEEGSGQLQQRAMPNAGQASCNPMGHLGATAIKALSSINPESLYKAAKIGGIQIGPEGDDPYHVSLQKS